MTENNDRLVVDIQRLVADDSVPKDADFRCWLEAVLDEAGPASVNLRIVDEAEGWALNRQWRGKDSATNVLSFPADMPLIEGRRILGDIVLCAPVIAREALQQGKNPLHHWAHLCVHGGLHLLGFDHTEADEAERMEVIEIERLARLNIPNPY